MSTQDALETLPMPRHRKSVLDDDSHMFLDRAVAAQLRARDAAARFAEMQRRLE